LTLGGIPKVYNIKKRSTTLFTRAGIINFIDHKSQDLDLSWGPADVQLHMYMYINREPSQHEITERYSPLRASLSLEIGFLNGVWGEGGWMSRHIKSQPDIR